MNLRTKEMDIDEELRGVKEEIAAEYRGNIRAMLLDLRKRQQESGRKVVSFDTSSALTEESLTIGK